MIRSIRVTLNLWYVAILALILGLFSVLFYVSAAANLSQDVDKTLALQASGVADTVFAFWRAERAGVGTGPGNWQGAPAQTFEGEINQGGLPALLSRWAQKTGNLETEHPVRLLDSDGQPLGASPSFPPAITPPDRSVIAQVQQKHAVYATVPNPDFRIRLITHPVAGGSGRVLYCVQIAASLHDVDASLAKLRFWLLVLVPSMLLVTSSVGWTLASAAQGPIRQVIVQARQFIAESLHERIDAPHAHDEVEELGTTFAEMVERLERALRRLRQFSAAASHELRTPLTVMKGEIEVALRRSRSVEEYQRVLRTHLDAIDEMAQTVEELLRLAQTEAAEGEAEWRAVDLGAMAQRVRDTMARLARVKATRIEVAAPEPVWVRGDPRLLERLLTNLVENATKYSPPKSLITVLAERRGAEASLIVQDAGPGIAPERMPQLFDQFFHRRTTETHPDSTGLGLGLCRWITELHHGQIDVASVPGRGTVFAVRLPLTAPPA